ncbi:MMPL family transporter [Candidatus Microthrix sp.]|mgnify:FL=1|uniref:MMPL family transporter n=1 Tax=Candidatus Neomicrothrix sp. TaxID=2719034 RepID=UPI002593EC4D|nr:MMPL family transporter [Candidatus Microthrix sp.]HMS48241.1 MMPL family transporter [Candidatus Microthrix sp.]
MFRRLANWCHDRRRLVVGLWLLALVGGGALSSVIGTQFRTEFNLPNVESRAGLDLLEKEFGGGAGGQSGTIVFQSELPVTDPAVQKPMTELFDTVATMPDVEGVVSPYSEEGARQIAPLGEQAGKIAYAEVKLDEDIDVERGAELQKKIAEAAPTIDGVDIEFGGQIFAEFESPSSEILGLAFAIVILILAFGSVLAMGLPVGVSLFGIGIGSISVALLSNVFTIPDFATVLGVMIGLGVGIDYALFIVTRYREQLHAGHTVREATSIAIDTAGRAVVFAGTTVVISLMGMLIMGVSFVTGLAIGAASVVAVTIVASVTLLPALLGFAGERVELTRWRGLIAAGLAALALVGAGLNFTPLLLAFPVAVVVLIAGFFAGPLKREVPMRRQKPLRETIAYRWSRVVQRHPWASVFIGALLLIGMALPVFGLRLGFSDEGNFPENTTTRKAYDLLAEGFGPGFNGPFLMVAELPDGFDAEALAPIEAAVQDDPGVVFVTPAMPNDEKDPAAATAVQWAVIPTSSPQAEETTDTVNRLRADVLPAAERAAGVDVALTGSVPVQVDFSEYLASRLPYFFGAVLALSFLLLMAVFRSLLVPLKAVVMNLLSMGAAYGLVVALFQWGWLNGITGIQTGPIEPFVPMMLFAIVFGLSMDYEVFLLSRVREEWQRTGDSHTSVADGLAATAKVITAAAAIMVFVFGSFVLESDRIIKLFGVGLASSIFLDATVVRMLLVPATMELLGDKNWWLPGWLDRLLPNIDVEGNVDDELPVDEPPSPEAPPQDRTPELIG